MVTQDPLSGAAGNADLSACPGRRSVATLTGKCLAWALLRLACRPHLAGYHSRGVEETTHSATRSRHWNLPADVGDVRSSHRRCLIFFTSTTSVRKRWPTLSASIDWAHWWRPGLIVGESIWGVINTRLIVGLLDRRPDRARRRDLRACSLARIGRVRRRDRVTVSVDVATVESGAVGRGCCLARLLGAAHLTLSRA